MDVFSPFAFKFGILLFFCICLGNLVFSWLCILFKVRILKFVLLSEFFDKYIFKRKINETEYILGWFPASGYIKPLGMLVEENEIDSMLEEEKKYALVSKSKIQQIVFKSSQYLVMPILLLLFVYLIDPQENYIKNLESVFVYSLNAFKAMFGIIPKADFESFSREITRNYQLLPFSLMIASIIFIILNPINLIMQIFINDKIGKLYKVFGAILIIFLFYLAFWKIPAFVFSFFSLNSLLKYIICSLIGIYIASFITYWLIILLVKLNTKQ